MITYLQKVSFKSHRFAYPSMPILILAAFLSIARMAAAGQQERAGWPFPLPAAPAETSAFQASPALGPDGTVYINSFDALYPLTPSGTLVTTWPSTGAPFTIPNTGFNFRSQAGVASSPTISDSGLAVYVGGVDKNNPVGAGAYALYGFNTTGTSPGSPLWPNNPPSSFFPVDTVGIELSTPTLGPDGTIFIAASGQNGNLGGANNSGVLNAVNQNNGVVKWAITSAPYSDSDIEMSPAAAADGTVYALETGINMLGAWPPNGDPNNPEWLATVPAEYEDGSLNFIGGLLSQDCRFDSSPAIDADGTIYIGGGFGVFAINPDGTTKWVFTPARKDTTSERMFQSSPAIGPDGTVYIGGEDGIFYALDTTSTSINHKKWVFDPTSTWQQIDNQTPPSPLPILSSPAVAADGTIYITMQDPNHPEAQSYGTSNDPHLGYAYLFALSPVDGHVLWTFPLPSGTNGVEDQYTSSSPTIGPDGTIYVATENRVHAIVSSNPTIPLPPLATSPWPMFHHDPRHTGRAGSPLYFQNHFSGYYEHSLAAKRDGTVWAWGANYAGQLGDNVQSGSSVPKQVRDSSGTGYFSGAIAVAAGFIHSLALKSDGTVWAWGDNASGELGNNTANQSLIPVQVLDFSGHSYMSGITSVSAGYESSYAVGPGGIVWAWGNDASGQLGNTAASTTGPNELPGEVGVATGGPIYGVISVSSGYNIQSQYSYTLALKSDGTVWAWGANNGGELGNNPTSLPQSTLAVQVHDYTGNSFLSGIVAISARGRCLALSSDGTVWAWGLSPLGNNSPNGSFLPVHVLDSSMNPLSGVTGIVSGDDHNYALKSDGTVWAWGNNSDGQLGNNTTTTSLIATQVLDLTIQGVTAPAMGITSGQYSGGCVMQDLSLRTWGFNAQGWLGDGTETTRLVPVTVVGPLGTGSFGL
jgi:alpha-tubulin suppressor-like RCC1 family protein